MLLFLLLQLVVKRLKLATLIALITCKHSVDVLAERDFGTESIHLLVVIGVAWHAEGWGCSLSLLAAGREFIKVGGLLHHAAVSSFVLVARCHVVFTDWISLHLVDGLNLHWQFDTLVNANLVGVSLGSGRVGVSIHAHELLSSVCSPLTRGTLFGKGLVATSKGRRTTIIAVSHHLEVDLTIGTQLAPTQILCLVFNNHFLKKVIFLVDVLFTNRLGSLVASSFLVLAHISGLNTLYIWIQILKVDFVAVFIFKGVQTAVRPLFKQKLGQVAGRDKVVSLRVEGWSLGLIAWFTWLSFLVTIFSVLSASFFVHPQSIGINTPVSLVTWSFRNLAAVYVLVLVWIWLLEITSILIHVARLAELHSLCVASVIRFHSNLRWDEVLGRVFGLLPWLIALVEFGVVNCLLVSHIWGAWHYIHICHSWSDLAHLAHWANLIVHHALLLQGVLVVRSHRCPRFGWLSAFATIAIGVFILILFGLSSSLRLSLTICYNKLINFSFSQIIEPRLGQGIESGETLFRVQSQQTFQALDSLWCHFSHVAAFECLWLRFWGELKADEAWVFVKQFLLMSCQFAKYLLDAEKLIDFRLSGEKRVSISNLAHNASNRPNIYFFAVVIT